MAFVCDCVACSKELSAGAESPSVTGTEVAGRLAAVTLTTRPAMNSLRVTRDMKLSVMEPAFEAGLLLPMLLNLFQGASTSFWHEFPDVQKADCR